MTIIFDKIVKWLDVRKDHLKRLLIDKFEAQYYNNIEKLKIKNKNRGSHYVEHILVTPDCFK